MEEEIARINRIVVTTLKDQNGEQKFCLRYLSDFQSKQGILTIQHAFTEESLREMASAFQQAIDYIDRQ
ncbi:MAG: hypothetical protein QNK29_14125 [Desulfobacterales bacterium]|nr:hypothetical protein [Desulfobacterales bacterium]MDX2513121.1 hypothetical protein [Desulfobacterales bacterium]